MEPMIYVKNGEKTKMPKKNEWGTKRPMATTPARLLITDVPAAMQAGGMAINPEASAASLPAPPGPPPATAPAHNAAPVLQQRAG
jgi:hypothetical protein